MGVLGDCWKRRGDGLVRTGIGSRDSFFYFWRTAGWPKASDEECIR